MRVFFQIECEPSARRRDRKTLDVQVRLTRSLRLRYDMICTE
jgi:hypothetical protein